ncbi:hypothetical protein EHZ77_09845 [Aeromonas dhakensis]|nr:hypothetical protein EHZ77_09845 [Aeromonas dhakensis]
MGRGRCWLCECGTKANCPTARLPDCPTARLPDCPTARLPDCQTAKLPIATLCIQFCYLRTCDVE